MMAVQGGEGERGKGCWKRDERTREREREGERAGMEGWEGGVGTWGEVLCFINQDTVVFSDLRVLQLVQFQVAFKNDTKHLLLQ